MKCGVALGALNTKDWDRVLANDWTHGPVTPDHIIWDETLELGSMVEPLGFDSIWSGEHFATPYGMCPNALQHLAFWAGRTEQVDVGTLVVVLPWWHPVRVVHEIAMLDILLQGRKYTIGVGRGLSPKEFGPLGVPQDEARQRFDETLDIIRLGLTQERFSYDGRIFRIPEMSVRPRPRHSDLLENAVGAFMTSTSLENIAKSGLGHIVANQQAFEKVGHNAALFNRYRVEAGLPGDNQPIVYLWAYCVEDERTADVAYRYLMAPDAAHHYGFDDPNAFAGVKGYEHYGKLAKGMAPPTPTGGIPEVLQEQLIGTPDQLIEKVQSMQRKTSAKEIVVLFNYGGMPHAASKRSMELFAREVLPAIHELDAPLHEYALAD
jgi:alkanesulfonate monooxygenase SsuD/methylene tetrahydromethanopterin reductase-like flavin-dependent oxidoreductase (luciferase family)